LPHCLVHSKQNFDRGHDSMLSSFTLYIHVITKLTHVPLRCN
jgi:hypothetical protein